MRYDRPPCAAAESRACRGECRRAEPPCWRSEHRLQEPGWKTWESQKGLTQKTEGLEPKSMLRALLLLCAMDRRRMIGKRFSSKNHSNTVTTASTVG